MRPQWRAHAGRLTKAGLLFINPREYDYSLLVKDSDKLMDRHNDRQQ
jgi:hypothetical protein